jgi:cardiolipin synthase
MAKDQIWKMYAELFRKASSELTIMCSYFLPGIVYRNILKAAIQRGVKVRVILAGKSDIKVAKYAERYLYRWMLRNGLEIYEYQPSVLHAKVAVADAIWLTVGSYNINDISAYASIELNLEVKSKALGREMQQLLQHIIERDCIHITSQKAIKLFSWAHVVQLISYYVIRVLLKLSTFYFKRQE